MIIVISNAGQNENIEVPLGSEIGHVRSLQHILEDIGAPSSYTFAVNGVGTEDSYRLQPNDIVTFRPVSANKG